MEMVLSILDLLKWPIAVIVIALIFRRSIKDLIGRTKKLKGGNFGLETEVNQSGDQMGLKSSNSKLEEIEKGLHIISDDTRKHFAAQIINDTKLEEAKSEEEKAKILFAYCEALYFYFQFERVYSLIFGSQIRILNHLNSSFHETTESIKFFYDSAVERNPELSKYPYEDYLDFLKFQGLTLIGEEGSIVITSFGRDFLKFLIDSGKSDLRPN